MYAFLYFAMKIIERNYIQGWLLYSSMYLNTLAYQK